MMKVRGSKNLAKKQTWQGVTYQLLAMRMCLVIDIDSRIRAIIVE